MHWEELTSPGFAEAVRTTGGVCLVPIGCLERHGSHLPLGTDYLFAKHLAGEAARIEPAIVFPPYYFGQINEAKHYPGAVAFGHEMLMKILEATCDEIARNGLDKIVLVNAHGGNTSFLRFFCQVMLERQRDYVVYLFEDQSMDPAVKAMMESAHDGHAGEVETSLMLVVQPETVHMDQVGKDGHRRGRMKEFEGKLSTAVGWYANFPTHYAGQGEYGSQRKGQALIEDAAKRLAAAIRLVKTNDTAARLQAEFFSQCRHDKGA